MTTTLEITNSSVFTTAKLPENFDREILGHYGDNGGDPDGNAWLPSETVGLDFDTRWLVSNGYGHMTEINYANDAALRHLTGIHLGEDWSDDDDTIDSIKAWFNDNTGGWAHYGAYGAGDSVWVYKPLMSVAGVRAG